MKKFYLFLKSFKTAADLKEAQMSLYDYQMMVKLFNDLKVNKKCHFMNSRAFKILLSFKSFIIVRDGIGWTATPKN